MSEKKEMDRLFAKALENSEYLNKRADNMDTAESDRWLNELADDLSRNIALGYFDIAERNAKQILQILQKANSNE